MTSLYEHMRIELDRLRAEGKTPLRWRIRDDAFRQLLGRSEHDANPAQVRGHPLTILGLPYDVAMTRQGLGAELIAADDS